MARLGKTSFVFLWIKFRKVRWAKVTKNLAVEIIRYQNKQVFNLIQ